MDMDEEDFVFYGTPIEREEELTSRKRKAVAEASGQLRALPAWKQEVRDAEGRRRFHGAFTGGFSAGYYNTVGSKEGWAPSSFTSSRKNRVEVKQQSILSFLDEDEKAEFEGRSLGTSSQFDTFGFTAVEFARKQAEKEEQNRPSAIPGPIPDELILPATESIGVKLLLKMGWRHSRSIKDSNPSSLYDARREARKAFLAFSSDVAKMQHTDSEPGDIYLESFVEQSIKDDTQSFKTPPVRMLNPKQDMYGLGYDPYKNAPEFREKKKSRLLDDRERGSRKPLSMRDSLFGFKSGKATSGFGIGALEEYNAEDEDIYTTAYDLEDSYVKEVEELSIPSAGQQQKLAWKEPGVLPGFRVASNSDYQLERFDLPAIPKDSVPYHKFQVPLEAESQETFPPPTDVPPPEDNNLKILIEGVASLVARCGKLFEDLAREKNQSNSLFSFLSGGNGHDYYAKKLWEERRKHGNQRKVGLDDKSSQPKMTAESRGKILGERPLERSSRDSTSSVGSVDANIQFNLSDTFTKPASSITGLQSEIPDEKPFKDDLAKQARFEQFLKEKYRGGLRTIDSGGASIMSEAARARERLDFEAAAEAIEKGKWGQETKLFTQHLVEFSASGAMQFTSGGFVHGKDSQTEDIGMKKLYPKREEFQWRPSPILCKRFDLIDPYMGKAPPPPRVRSKMDTLIFTSDTAKATKVEETVSSHKDRLSVFQSGAQEISKDVADRELEVEVEVENVERPVDLYKAIFSDDSDDEAEVSTVNKAENPERKIEVAHTTLNRLIAGDFLESLGKELGLEVPPDVPYSMNKAKAAALQKETENPDVEDVNILPLESKSSTSANVHGVASINQGLLSNQEIPKGGGSQKDKPSHGSSRYTEGSPPDDKSGRVDFEKTAQRDNKAKSFNSHHQDHSSSLSSEEESRKSSRRRRYKSNDSRSDSSSDHRDRKHSKSKGRNKESSREKKSSSRKHSKHHKHRSRESLRRSLHSAERERAEAKREKRKGMD